MHCCCHASSYLASATSFPRASIVFCKRLYGSNKNVKANHIPYEDVYEQGIENSDSPGYKGKYYYDGSDSIARRNNLRPTKSGDNSIRQWRQQKRALLMADFAEQKEGDNRQQRSAKKALKVAVIGCPNVGKSALTNALIRAPICPVSRRVDTTRANLTTALTEDRIQLVVVDSPGLIGLKHAKKLIQTHSDDRILGDPEKAIRYAGSVVVVQDATAPGAYLHHRLLHLLHRYSHIPTCLVLNKIDLVESRSDLVSLVQTLTEGVVDDQKIQTKPIRMGLLDAILSKQQHQNGDPNQQHRSKNERGLIGTLHPEPSSASPQVGSTGENDHTSGSLPTPSIFSDSNGQAKNDTRIRSPEKEREEWLALFNRLLKKPTHKCSWAETRRLFLGRCGWPHFKAVFFASALTGEGVNPLRQWLKMQADPVDSWNMDPYAAVYRNPAHLCVDHIRSELLNHCPAYMAYSAPIKIVHWELDHDRRLLEAVADIICEKRHWIKFVLEACPIVEKKVASVLGKMVGTPNIQFRLRVKFDGKLVESVDESAVSADDDRSSR